MDKLFNKIFKKKSSKETEQPVIQPNQTNILITGTEAIEVEQPSIQINPQPANFPTNEIIMLNTDITPKNKAGHYYHKYIGKIEKMTLVNILLTY
jgi:hypothetical protein